MSKRVKPPELPGDRDLCSVEAQIEARKQSPCRVYKVRGPELVSRPVAGDFLRQIRLKDKRNGIFFEIFFEDT